MAKHEIQCLIEELYGRYGAVTDGEVATYIPELARADPDDLGISIVTWDGRIFETGECHKPFTMQSITKPFTFGMAIEELGREKVFRHVGVEPSGEPFNSIELEPGTNRPFNPMVNAGAIAVTALLHAKYGDRTFAQILSRLSAAAARDLTIDQAVYESELVTGHRNRAIAYLLLNFGMVEDRAEEVLDVYFRQCAVSTTCHDLATMAATLSNMGHNPITGKVVFDHVSVKDILSIMFTCGMYDYSGRWAYEVGVPAKSGVSGGVMATVNRQLGLASYSPRLDSHGNSLRGIRICADLASRLGLHSFDVLNPGSHYLDAVL